MHILFEFKLVRANVFQNGFYLGLLFSENRLVVSQSIVINTSKSKSLQIPVGVRQGLIVPIRFMSRFTGFF